jgi:hypothetical protein
VVSAPRQLTPDVEGEEYELRRPGDARLYDTEVDAKIIAWRAECFVRLGFTPLAARALAMRRDVDREQVERLLKLGATRRQVRTLVL